MSNNTNNKLLTKAIQIAAQAHADQTDKGGSPYIFHPLRVMLSLDSISEQICGVLHDVIEDTDTNLNELRKLGFSEEIVVALDLLTRRSDESYDEFIDRMLGNPIACHVKLADLKDNMNISRISSPTAKDYERISKYKKAVKKIEYYLGEKKD